MFNVYKLDLIHFSDMEVFQKFYDFVIGEMIKQYHLDPGNYTLEVKTLYWNNFRINEEVDKCRIDAGLYGNLIGKPNTQFVSREELKEWAESIKPYDIKLEINGFTPEQCRVQFLEYKERNEI